MSTDKKFDSHAELGIVWLEEEVMKQSGENASSRVIVCGDAQIPSVVDFDKFRAAFSDAVALAYINGTSLRVQAQRVNRSHAKVDIFKRRELVLQAMRGVRAAPTARTVTKYALPDGTFYDGSDVTEYRALYTAALIDSGVEFKVAQTIAMLQNL